MIRSLRIIPIIAIVFALLPMSQGQQNLDSPLPVDPSVRVGQLDNGLKYYIRENKKPEGRAILRLVINAGSLQEEEDERGLAHFLEHMAFNGTKNFEKHDIIDFLENAGMKFGSHLNASTSFNETIYKLEIPLDKPEVVEKGFLILEDWASNILFEAEEIEKERGVVIEEWRARKGVRQRLQEKQIPLLYHGSKYVDRLPIGLVPVIETLTVEQFTDFYHKWYRPDLMAVIAVGDFSADEIEAKIREHFDGLENPSDAPERLEYPMANHTETFFSIETDPELSQSSAAILFKTDNREPDSIRSYRESTIERIYFSMINNRMRERAKQEAPPFLGAGVGKGSLGREKSLYQMSVGFLGTDYEGGLKAMMQELERARRDGFEQSEFDRVIVNIKRSMEKSYAERDKRKSSSFVGKYIGNFLSGSPIPSLEQSHAISNEFLKTIRLEEVNAVAKFIDQKTDRVVIFSAPEKEGIDKPSQVQLMTALQLTSDDKLEAYDDGVSDEPLMSITPVPGTISKEIYHESIDTFEWKLSNGIRVVAKSTDFKNDEIFATAFSPGGSSLFSDADLVSGSFSTMVLSQSGLGKYDTIQLKKKLAGKIASGRASIGDNYESLRGSASPKDLETLFQLLHMQFMEPRLDLKAYASVKTRIIASVENRLKNPNAVFGDAVSKALYGDHPRHRPMSVEIVEEIDPKKSLELFKDRFADASDFTFVFVGSVDIDILKTYLEKYVASLPNLGRVEKGTFNDDHKAKGQQVLTVAKNLEQKSTVQAIYHGPATWSPENSYALGFAKDILNIRLREKLREDESKVYGARVTAGLSRIPMETFSTGFSFTCDPGNADELVALTQAEIKALQDEGPLDDDLEKIRQQRLRSYEKGIKENGYWLSAFSNYLKQDRPLETILDRPEMAKAFVGEDAQKAAQLYFDDQNLLIAKLDPMPTEVEKD